MANPALPLRGFGARRQRLGSLIIWGVPDLVTARERAAF